MRHNLVASLLLFLSLFPAAAIASQPVNDASATTEVRPVSTGVIPAKIVYTPPVGLPSDAIIPADAEVVLQLNVDETGKARDIQVVKSISPELDAPVLAAVSKFRFSPAMLDKQAVPVDMNLTVLVQR
jgi:TonB family protein